MTFEPRVAVVGLGYVGLPVALAASEVYPNTIGFDIDQRKLSKIKKGVDPTQEGFDSAIQKSSISVTSRVEDLSNCDFFVVTVPTPVDEYKKPDLSMVAAASSSIGKIIKPGAIVVFESTVYPGITEDFCGPLIEEASGLKSGVDFKLGYSPERINPGDKVHTLENIVKVVSGQDQETLEKVATFYERFVTAGVHRAASIKVAEAAKVIENTQRDVNIALMNELSVIFEKIDIRTKDVLDAAGTKWNFLKFVPGLVGGHCIGVDPYYLTSLAEKCGHYPEVILSGRRINDGMGRYVVNKAVRMMLNSDIAIKGARVGVLGLTFKENIADIRNSRVPDIVKELRAYGVEPIVSDSCCDAEEAFDEYAVRLVQHSEMKNLDCCILAVPHDYLIEKGMNYVEDMVIEGGILVDVKSIFDPREVRKDLRYWSV